MFVTTTTDPLPEQIERANQLAQQFDKPFIPRNKRSIRVLMDRYAHHECLVVERKELRFLSENQKPLFFHPSSGMLRIKRLEKGEMDGLTQIADIQPGDRILDATCGFASDAIVLQFAAGLSGQVIALESSAVLATIVKDGLKRYAGIDQHYLDVFRKIEVYHANYQDYLKSCADCSFDVIYFDPMFHIALEESKHLEPLRALANHAPLLEESVHEACRVAKRCVILKDHQASPVFEQLGFEAPIRRWTSVRYGKIMTKSTVEVQQE